MAAPDDAPDNLSNNNNNNNNNDGHYGTARPPLRTLAAALRYADHGWHVFPLHSRLRSSGGCTCHRPDCPQAAKHPLTGHGFHDAHTRDAVLRAWWTRWPFANVAIATGLISHLIVLDIDPRHGGWASLAELEARYGPLPPTLAVRTGGGGEHRYFAHPHDGRPMPLLVGLMRRQDQLDGKPKAAIRSSECDGLDIRGDGGYVAAPPSLHISGNRYAWLNPKTPIAPLPGWLADLIVRKPHELKRPAAVNSAAAPAPGTGGGNGILDDGAYWLRRALDRTGDGVGDPTGYWLAQQLLVNHVADAERVLTQYAQEATVDPRRPFDGRDVERWLRSARQSDVVRFGEPARPRTRARLSLVTPATPARRAVDDAPPAPSSDVRDDDTSTEDDTAGDDTVGNDDEDGGGTVSPAQGYPWTEMGNAHRLLDRYGAKFRYCPAFGWVVWDGRRWAPDGELMVRSWAEETIRAMYQEAADLQAAAALEADEIERKRKAQLAEGLSAWSRKSERDRMVTAMLSLARPHCVVSADAFDADPLLLNLANGTLDLRTGRLHPHRRDDYQMMLAPVAYDPQASAPRFAQFVDELMLARPALVSYLQRALGYALTGDVSEQVWHLMIGEGENGKGTLMELLAELLGDYAGLMEPESLVVSAIARDGSAPSPDIADLKGKRFVRVTETEEGARLAPARIKKLSGGDTLKARRLRREPFIFRPTFKIFIYTNHRPQARETTHAFWRRVRMVPFDMNLREHPERKDPHLLETLRTEGPGILNWLIAGCLAWRQDGGLTPPPEVVEMTESYRDEQDVLKQFFTDCCFVDPTAKARATPLYESYVEWCKESGMRALQRPRFSASLRERGFTRQHRRNGDVWEGLGMLDGSYRTSVPDEEPYRDRDDDDG